VDARSVRLQALGDGYLAECQDGVLLLVIHAYQQLSPVTPLARQVLASLPGITADALAVMHGSKRSPHRLAHVLNALRLC